MDLTHVVSGTWLDITFHTKNLVCPLNVSMKEVTFVAEMLVPLHMRQVYNDLENEKKNKSDEAFVMKATEGQQAHIHLLFQLLFISGGRWRKIEEKYTNFRRPTMEKVDYSVEHLTGNFSVRADLSNNLELAFQDDVWQIEASKTLAESEIILYKISGLFFQHWSQFMPIHSSECQNDGLFHNQSNYCFNITGQFQETVQCYLFFREKFWLGWFWTNAPCPKDSKHENWYSGVVHWKRLNTTHCIKAENTYIDKFNTLRSWKQAKKTCHSAHGMLPVLRTQAELFSFVALLKMIGLPFVKAIFLGLSGALRQRVRHGWQQ